MSLSTTATVLLRSAATMPAGIAIFGMVPALALGAV